jgi:hypothetical protein
MSQISENAQENAINGGDAEGETSCHSALKNS